MQHAEAVRDGMAERYVLGELEEQQALEYEAHFFDCPECAEDVKAAAVLAGGAREIFHAEAGQAVRREQPRPRHTRRFGWRPMGIAAAVAVLAVGAVAYQAWVLVPGLRREVAQVHSLQAAPWFFLSISRAEPQVLTVAPGQRMVGLTLSRSSQQSHPFYRCRLVDSAGRTVETATVPGPPRGGELQLLLPAARINPGAYTIELSALDEAGAPVGPHNDVVRYSFELRREEEKQ